MLTTLNKDMIRAKSRKGDFPIPTLKRVEDFVYLRSIAQDRKAWRRFSDAVCRAADAKIILNTNTMYA